MYLITVKVVREVHIINYVWKHNLCLLIAIDVIIQYTKLEIQIYIFFHSLKSEWLPTIFFQKVLPVCVKDRKKVCLKEKKSFLRTFCIFLPRVAVMIALSPLTLLKSFSHTNTHTKSSSEHTHTLTPTHTNTHKVIIRTHKMKMRGKNNDG